jgi:DNA-binding transcriptional LysR family regulator
MAWRFDDVQTFLKVVDAGGVTAAANELKLSKSVVSKRISDLEDALGVALLRRSTRSVSPTEQGLLFYEQMRDALRVIESAVEGAMDRAGSLKGRLHITAPMSFATLHLGPLLADFASLHPGLEFAIDLDDRMLDLVAGSHDLAIRIGRLPDSSLIARKLCESRRVVCCSPEYVRRKALPNSIAEITGHDCIDYANAHANQLWQFLPVAPDMRPRTVATHSRLVANNGEVMRDFAIAGLGLAVLPLFIVADEIRTGRLIHVLPEDSPLPDTIYAVYPPTRHVPQRVRALVDYLGQRLANAALWEQVPARRESG